MRGTMLYGPRDVRFEERPDPKIISRRTRSSGSRRPACAGPTCGPTAALNRQPAHPDGPRVRRHRRGGRQRGRPSSRASSSSARSSPPTTPARTAGPATSRRCVHREFVGDLPSRGGPRPARRRHPGRDAGQPARELIPACCRSRTCWAPAGSPPWPPRSDPARPSRSSATARSACCGVLAARQLGAERIIAMSRHAPRQKLAREFGATDIVTERGDEGVPRSRK